MALYTILTVSVLLMLPGMLSAQSEAGWSLQVNEEQREVKILFGGKWLTSYLYEETMEKPVLFPIHTKTGSILTRGYPRNPKPGERADHPHHLGYWLNYGDVNGLDFWNNSSQIPAERKHRYGKIQHRKIKALEEGENGATLVVEAAWISPSGTVLLDEMTTFNFSAEADTWMVDRHTTLTAREQVSFKDNKEGMIGIRVARSLELPSDSPVTLLAEDGQPAAEKVIDNEGVFGDYLSSEGVQGTEVWGTRASWMKLFTTGDGPERALVLIDHPENVGYPTYWHARGYGLFAANPLGQEIFSRGKQVLDFSLAKGASTTFRYRLLVHEGSSLATSDIARFRNQFIGEH